MKEQSRTRSLHCPHPLQPPTPKPNVNFNYLGPLGPCVQQTNHQVCIGTSGSIGSLRSSVRSFGRPALIIWRVCIVCVSHYLLTLPYPEATPYICMAKSFCFCAPKVLHCVYLKRGTTSFIPSIPHGFIHSFIHSFAHSFIHSLTLSVIHSVSHSFIQILCCIFYV